MFRRRLLALLAAAAVVACGRDQGRLSEGLLVIETATGPVEVRVEIAETAQARSRGLMGRRFLPEDGGMVFLHEEPVPSSFTMEETLIPLSLAVWGTDGTILAILDMEPCSEEPCPSYEPGVAWVGAVEVNRGFFADQGVAVGDRVRLERPP